MKLNNVSLQIPLMVCSLLLLVGAVVDFPKDYYHVLRVAIFCTSIYAGLYALQIAKPFWLLVLAIVAILYNPIHRLHFERGVWDIMDVVTIIVFMVCFLVLSRD